MDTPRRPSPSSLALERKKKLPSRKCLNTDTTYLQEFVPCRPSTRPRDRPREDRRTSPHAEALEIDSPLLSDSTTTKKEKKKEEKKEDNRQDETPVRDSARDPPRTAQENRVKGTGDLHACIHTRFHRSISIAVSPYTCTCRRRNDKTSNGQEKEKAGQYHLVVPYQERAREGGEGGMAASNRRRLAQTRRPSTRERQKKRKKKPQLKPRRLLHLPRL